MKPKPFLRSFLAAIGGSIIAISSASAQTDLYWSGNGTTLGGGGTWNTTDARWGSNAAGPFSSVWDNNEVDTAIFSSTVPGTVPLDTPITVGGLRFEIGGYTLSGSTLTLAGDADIFTRFGTTTISSVIDGSVGLVKTGPGTLTLSGSAVNTFTGGLDINGGTLLLNSQNLATPTDLLNSGNNVALGGGILSITGKTTGTTEQTLGNVTVNAGGGRILGNKNGGTSTTIALGGITATAAGGSLLLGAGGTNANLPVITTSATNDATGILGGRSVYFDGTANTGYNFAVSNGGTIGAYTSYAAFTASGTDSGTNYVLQTTAITGVETQSVNSLKIVGVNLTQTADTTLTIESGGLLSASGTGSTISGGSLTAGNGSGSYDLVVFQGGTGGGQMTITSNVIDHGENAVNFVKVGPGTTVLNGAKSYTGNTYVNAGILDFGNAAPAGTGRNIYVTPGALVKFSIPSTALLSRIAQSAEEIGIVTTSGANAAIDFSPTGADLPNAFLAGGWFSNGAKNDNFTGTITPANNTYRIGFPGAAGSFGVSTILGGEGNGLIVGGNNVVLTNANTFGGETVIRTGASLLLANTLALQNSAINLGTPTGSPIAGSFGLSRLSQNVVNDKLVTSATIGGLIGSRNMATAYGGAYGNNAGFLNTVAVRGFTLNPGTGASHTYTGVIANFTRDTTITKTGEGTQQLGGNNSYSGETTINDGVLAIGNANALGRGGSAGTSSGATIINSGGTLDLNGVTGGVEPIVLNGTGFGGNGALVNNSATAASIDGGIASLQITDGGTYTTAPTVSISGAGTGATATVQLGLTNASLSISGGSGWVAGDLFTVNAGGGSGAVYEVTSVNAGAITGVNLVNGGSGYTSAPTGITKLTRTGTATGTLTLSFNADNFAVSGLTLTNPGSGYDDMTTVSFSAGDAAADVQYSSVTLASDSSIGGSGDITIEAGLAESGGSQSLTKVGAGTLTLSGVNTYSGNTTVTGGTLSLAANNTSNNSSTVTIGTSGILQLTYTGTDNVDKLFIGATQQPAGVYGHSSTGANNGEQGVGALDARFASGTGTLTVASSPPSGSPYDTWSGGAPFGADANGDGVSNGLAFLLGAANPNVSALDKLPTVTETSGGLVMTFSMLDATARGTAVLALEHSNTLATGSWTTIPVPDTSSTVADVVFTVTGTGPLNVTATIPVSKADGGKLFGRLKATE